MSLPTKLLAGAALCAMLTAATTADARTSRPAPAATAAEVTALRAQIQALEQRLATQEQAQQQTQAQAQQAQSAAEEARALQAQADRDIKTIPAKVKAEVAAAKPKPGWEANTSVSGRMYFDLTHVDVKRDGAKVAPSGTGFDIKRFYVGVDHKFNDIFSANVTTDVAYVSGDGLTQVYLKKAYLQAKVNDALTVRLGAADLPWVPFAESVYGYRHIENTVIDRDKFGTSADWGVHAAGKVGIVDYAVAAINGAGYKNPSRSKAMDLEGRVSTTLNNVTVGVGGYSGKLGKDVHGAATYHTARRFDAIVGYKAGPVRVGAEYFASKNWNNVTTLAQDKADGYSLFGAYNFTPQIAAFGRVDWVNPSKDLNPDVKDRYFNIGINYQPTKIVDLALVYKRDKVDDGLVSTANGTIGGVRGGTYDEVGLFGQVRW